MILENVGGYCQIKVISSFLSEILRMKVENRNEHATW